MIENTYRARNYAELKSIIKTKGGFVSAGWCGNVKCEEKIKDETSAKITNLPFDLQKNVSGKCVLCGGVAKFVANFARSY